MSEYVKDIGFWILFGFLLIHPVLAIIFRSRSGSASDYVLAGRTVSAASASASLLATALGASSVIGLCGLAARYGVMAALWLASGAVGLLLLRAMVPRIDFNNAFTLPQMLGASRSGSLRLLTAMILLPAWIGIIAAQYIAIGKIVQAVFPHMFGVALVTSAVVVALYVAIAGQRGVIRTDRFQLAFLTLFLIALFASLSIREAPHVDSAPFQTMPIGQAVGIFLAVGFAFLVGPDMYSRLLTVRSASERLRALSFAVAGMLLATFLIVAIGMLSKAWMPEGGEGVMTRLPFLIWGNAGGVLAMAALLSAVLSSADTCLLTASTIFTQDLLGREGQARPIRIAAFLISLSAAVLGLFLEDIIASLLLAYTVYTSGLAIPILFSLLGRPLPKKTLFVAVFVGAGIGLAGKLTPFSFALPLALGASFLIVRIGLQLEKR